eukprot:1037666-Prymnesium_polylepis.1
MSDEDVETVRPPDCERTARSHRGSRGVGSVSGGVGRRTTGGRPSLLFSEARRCWRVAGGAGRCDEQR